MKTVLAGLVVVALVGCAAPGTQYSQIYDHKYNEYRVVQTQSDSAFVGTSAKVSGTPRQHP